MIEAAASYPFMWAPSISYSVDIVFRVKRRNEVQFDIWIHHVAFPDYEVYVDSWWYNYKTCILGRPFGI